jgi:hypothetical protein
VDPHNHPCAVSPYDHHLVIAYRRAARQYVADEPRGIVDCARRVGCDAERSPERIGAFTQPRRSSPQFGRATVMPDDRTATIANADAKWQHVQKAARLTVAIFADQSQVRQMVIR